MQVLYILLHLQSVDDPLCMQASARQCEADRNKSTDVHSVSGSQHLHDTGRANADTGPSISLGQRMKKSQASGRPLPLSECPLTFPGPSGAAYPLPQQAKHAAAYPVPKHAKHAATDLVPQQAQQARSAMLPDQTSLNDAALYCQYPAHASHKLLANIQLAVSILYLC